MCLSDFLQRVRWAQMSLSYWVLIIQSSCPINFQRIYPWTRFSYAKYLQQDNLNYSQGSSTTILSFLPNKYAIFNHLQLISWKKSAQPYRNLPYNVSQFSLVTIMHICNLGSPPFRLVAPAKTLPKALQPEFEFYYLGREYATLGDISWSWCLPLSSPSLE
jgi:hypothetical protein